MPEAAVNTEQGADTITLKLEKSVKEENSLNDGESEKDSVSAFSVAKGPTGREENNIDVYNFDSFIQRMRHPSCKPILENIKR